MYIYNYTKISHDGKKVYGALQANNYQEAMRKILKDNCEIISLHFNLWNYFFNQSLNDEEIVTFFSHLSFLLKTGLALPLALQILGQSLSEKHQVITTGIVDDLKSGRSLFEAFVMYKQYFSSFSIQLLFVAEKCSNLPETCTQIASFHSNLLNYKKKISETLRYPALVCLIIFATLFMVFVYLLPGTIDLLKESHSDIPQIYHYIIQLNDFFIKNRLTSLVCILTFFITFYIKRYTILKNIPIISNYFRYKQYMLFFYSLSTGLKSGLSIIEAWKISNEYVDDKKMSKKFNTILREIINGKSISSGCESLNTEISHTIKIYENIGELDVGLLQIAQSYENKLFILLKLTQDYIQPILFIFLSVVIIFTGYLIFMPAFLVISNADIF